MRLNFSYNILLLISLFHQNLSGQLYDNTWMMGCCYTPISRLNGGINITFDKGYPDTFFFARNISFDASSMSISDPNTGELLFYSNGCNIYNKENKIMQQGNDINPGIIHDNWCIDYGYIMPKCGAILPNSGNEKKYYIIHRAYDNNGNIADRLYYSEIDLSYNQGFGKVTKINIPLLSQQMYRGQFEITKHANGIDYWVLAYNYTSDTIFRFLVDKDGIHGPHPQYFPIPRDKYDQRANSTISPDGKIAIRIDPSQGLFIMDFDRETGLLSNLKHYLYWSSIDSSPVTSVAFSPNSKLLYVSNRWRLYQFDFESSDIENSRILIDTFDYFSDPYPTAFYLMQLAPDGKIYMNCTNGVKYLHTIHKPNERGKTCDFRQHDLILPAQNAFTMPYFPNYRLGPVTDTKLESIGQELSIYPNPVRESIFINNPSKSFIKYEVKNLLNQLKQKGSFNQYIDMSNLKSGIYFLCLYEKSNKVINLKFEKI